MDVQYVYNTVGHTVCVSYKCSLKIPCISLLCIIVLIPRLFLHFSIVLLFKSPPFLTGFKKLYILLLLPFQFFHNPARSRDFVVVLW